MDRTTLTLTLELRLADGTFIGEASDDLGANRQFSGWLGLIAAIDELIETAPERSRDAVPPTHGLEDPRCS